MPLAQIKAADARWSDTGMVLHRVEATRFLEGSGEYFDAVFSVFDAVWFTGPAVLLPAIRRQLRPGGVLAFSHRPAARGGGRCPCAVAAAEDAAGTVGAAAADSRAPRRRRGLPLIEHSPPSQVCE
jgi:SAM-dependent methyltransferase